METNRGYFIGVRFDEENMHPIACNGGKIFENYEICRHDTVDNAEVMRVVPMTMPSNELTVVENITKALQETIETERECMERFVKHKDYDTANICQQRIIAYEKAITIAKTLF